MRPKQAQPIAAPNESLWNKAPAWRNLVVSASLLTGVALALPLIPQQETRPSAVPVVQRLHTNAPVMRTAALPTAPKPVAAAPAPAEPAPLSPARPVHRARSALAAPTQLASATPQPQTQSDACHLVGSSTPMPIGVGRVVSFVDRAASLTLIQATQRRAGGLIDPDYIDNQRVDIVLGNGVVRLALVPKTMQVRIGDMVAAQEGYRNVNLPCNYVPSLITSDLGPQKPDQPQAQAPQQ